MARVELAGLDLGVHVRPRTAQRAQRQPVQVFEQLALPRIPHLRAGAADVGHRQQVQRGQAPLAAHQRGEGLDHIGVGEVFLLRDARHRQVALDQEFDQCRIFAVNAVVAAEAPRFHRAQVGVVAATALGHVVEQRRDVQHVRLVPLQRELRAERVLVGMFRNEEAPHVAQHHDDVLVNRVDVKQVVLHLPHDAAEHPQVAAEHAGLVHQPQRMRLAFGLGQNFHEGGAVDRVAPKVAVHDFARVVQRAQRAR